MSLLLTRIAAELLSRVRSARRLGRLVEDEGPMTIGQARWDDEQAVMKAG